MGTRHMVPEFGPFLVQYASKMILQIFWPLSAFDRIVLEGMVIVVIVVVCLVSACFYEFCWINQEISEW